MANQQPWNKFTETGYVADPKNPRHKIWDTANFPFIVRWSVPTNDRLTRYVTFNRAFRTMNEAIVAYKMPFKGLSVDCVMFNGKEPGKHLDTLARRNACKATKWDSKVPIELRA